MPRGRTPAKDRWLLALLRCAGPAGILLLFLLSSLARATDAVILISPVKAGPVIDETLDLHGEWIYWPSVDRPGGANRVLSLLTGIDWMGRFGDLVFDLRDGRYLSAGFSDLRARGYFLARDRVVSGATFAVDGGSAPDRLATASATDSGMHVNRRADSTATVSPLALFLALDGRSPQVAVLRLDQPWPAGLAFAEVDGWDRVAAIAAKARGRTLVIEYPPPLGRRWSRYWMRGSGWGSLLPTWPIWGVPGLIPAAQAGNLIGHPNQFRWVENDVGNWGGANRWLSFVGRAAPLTLAVVGFLAMFFVGCTVYLISREEHARVGGTTTKYLVLLPATILLAGTLTRQLGSEGVVLWFVLGFFSLVCVSQLLGGLTRRMMPGAHSMFSMAIVGFVVCAGSPPLWSMYSNVFSENPLPISPDGAGGLFAYLAGVCALGRGDIWASWVGRVVALYCFGWGVGFNPWWVSGQWPFALFPLVALLIGERLFRLWMLPVLGLVPLLDGQLVRHGFVWAPGNLYPSYASSGGVNLARWAEFFASYGFLSTALIAGTMGVLVERYFFHEIRRTLLRDSRVTALFFASFACAALGLFQPLMLYSALICFLGAAFVLLADTAREV